tara:strand:+ start:175 stop:555 length:381 start_codon:yes stop_codon:yes gene_type:complete
MAHFAKLGKGNIVERVEVVTNDIATTEQAGVDFLKSLYGNDTVWKQTSYNANIRKNYAGLGYTYSVEKDAFISPQTHRGWKLNDETCKWEAPVAYPNTFTQNLTDENGEPMADIYYWNENKLKWEL